MSERYQLAAVQKRSQWRRAVRSATAAASKPGDGLDALRQPDRDSSGQHDIPERKTVAGAATLEHTIGRSQFPQFQTPKEMRFRHDVDGNGRS